MWSLVSFQIVIFILSEPARGNKTQRSAAKQYVDTVYGVWTVNAQKLRTAPLSTALYSHTDKPGSKDHPIFTRMPNFFISSYKEYEFDAHEFESTKEGKVTIEGHKYSISYVLQPGAKNPSALQIIRNHGNAIKKIGGTVEKEGPRTTSLKYEKDGAETWIYVWVTGTGNRYDLTIVEKEEMVQDEDYSQE